MTARIAVENVTVERQAIVNGRPQKLNILNDVSFSVPAGGRLSIAGPSGSGKTSLLRLLNRLEDPVKGQVLLDGQDIRKLDPVAVRRRVGMVFQQTFLFDRSVLENLAYPLNLMNRTLTREKAAELLDEVGLAEEFLDRQGQQLSGGQQQRVSVARSLALEPEVLLLDEPTSALDDESARILVNALLRRNADKGLTLVVVTHSRDMLLRLDCPTILTHDKTAREYPNAEDALQLIRSAHISLE